jgi:hypothetical protein
VIQEWLAERQLLSQTGDNDDLSLIDSVPRSQSLLRSIPSLRLINLSPFCDTVLR